jgi:lipid-binding SYLF domain-containing protein
MKFVFGFLTLLMVNQAVAESYPPQPVFRSGHPLLERNVQAIVYQASQTIANRMGSAYPIPPYVIQNAKCIASLRVVKAGFVWGGEGSTGLVSCRTPEGWSAPSIFNVGGVTWGLQIGVEFVDSIMVFMTDYMRQILSGPSVEFSGSLSLAAGPYGTGAGAGFTPSAQVLAYDAVAGGLYAGATFNGLVLTHAPIRNRIAYGVSVTPASILAAPGSRHTPPVLQPFYRTLTYYIP